MPLGLADCFPENSVINSVNSETLHCERRINLCNSLTHNPLRGLGVSCAISGTAKNSVTRLFHPLLYTSHFGTQLPASNSYYDEKYELRKKSLHSLQIRRSRESKVESGATEPMQITDYKIGRGRPPRQYSYKKGISGNPRGPGRLHLTSTRPDEELPPRARDSRVLPPGGRETEGDGRRTQQTFAHPERKGAAPNTAVWRSRRAKTE